MYEKFSNNLFMNINEFIKISNEVIKDKQFTFKIFETTFQNSIKKLQSNIKYEK